jgi:hypothetical protein
LTKPNAYANIIAMVNNPEQATPRPHRRSGDQLTRRGRAVVYAAAGLAAVGAAVGVADAVGYLREADGIHRQVTDPDALSNYRAGKIDPDKVRVMTATQDGTPWTTAKDFGAQGDVRPVATAIDAQDDINGVPGVQAGEQFVVPADQVGNPHESEIR